MRDDRKTKEPLTKELAQTRQRSAESEALEAAHKGAEEASRESEERPQRVLASVTGGIAATGVDGVMVDVNESALRPSGLSSKIDLVGISAFEPTSPLSTD